MDYSDIIKQMVSNVRVLFVKNFNTSDRDELREKLIDYLKTLYCFDPEDNFSENTISEIDVIIEYLFNQTGISFVQFIKYLDKYELM